MRVRKHHSKLECPNALSFLLSDEVSERTHIQIRLHCLESKGI